MLGCVWKAKLNTDHFKLQFISQGLSSEEIIRGIEEVLYGGGRWIQLRMKNANIADVVAVGNEVKKLCDSFNATFIIDDFVELVNEIGADGVHLGRNDMPVSQARKILGPSKIIGVTANTAEDIVEAYNEGADYIGLGPFRFTTTKKNLSPILGARGYVDILRTIRESGIELPVVAIGGITGNDIHDILATGVNGVAISGSILNAASPSKETERILTEIKHSFN